MRIREFQELMRKLYFSRDSERGIRGTYKWLTEEVEELGHALNSNNTEETEKEFADVIAWLASLANVKGIDLEAAALAKYPGTCPKCGHSPCECTF